MLRIGAGKVDLRITDTVNLPLIPCEDKLWGVHLEVGERNRAETERRVSDSTVGSASILVYFPFSSH